VQDLLRHCWASNPFERPAFSEVARDLKVLRKNAGYNPEDVQSPRMPDWVDWDMSQQVSRPSPDMHPIPLPSSSRKCCSGFELKLLMDFLNLARDTSYHLGTSPQSSDAASFRTARDLSQSPTFPSLLSHREETVTTSRVQKPEPVTYTPSETSSDTSSIFTSTPSSSGDEARNALLEYDGYDSPPPANETIAEQRNERRYRLLLQHEFHPSRECYMVLISFSILTCFL
jgi:abelson tyrosine-protein kinase 1